MVRKKRPSQRPGTAPSDSSGGAIVPRVPNGLPHGGRQALEAQASAGASAARQATAGSPVASASGSGLPARVPTEGIFQPTRRPNEPITAGANVGPGAGQQAPMLEEDPDMFLRAVAMKFPHPDILALVARANGRRR